MNSFLISGLLLLASEAAPAAEGAAAGGEGGGGGAAAILIPKLAELIPALISFAVVFFVLAKFAWPAISDMLDKRADTIRESLEKSEAAKIEAERLLEEYKQTMAEARKEAGTILQQAKQAADLVLLDANPLADIHNTQKIRSVVLHGRLYERAALDEMLAKAEQNAASLK